MPGYVTANDMNEIKAALILNNDALSEYSEDIHLTIDALADSIYSVKEVITDSEQVSIQAKIEQFQDSLSSQF